VISLSSTPTAAVGHRPLGVISAQGADSAKFLQGQLSANIEALAPGSTVLAGYHNVQGRAIALLRVSKLDHARLLLTLPKELVADVIARLSRYVLRAKIRLVDASDAVMVFGADRTTPINPSTAASALALLDWGDARRVALIAADQASTALDEAPSEVAAWQAADIADGLPQIYQETSEVFVAQMLNLDALGGIAFDKGCYTGQEVIARAHYRGRVKRRLQRFVSQQPMPSYVIGAVGTLDDGRTFKVVDAVQRDDGRCEWLAVAALAGGTNSDDDKLEPAPNDTVAAQSLPLPYALPD
jgi:folate-binding protein YgfZ